MQPYTRCPKDIDSLLSNHQQTIFADADGKSISLR